MKKKPTTPAFKGLLVSAVLILFSVVIISLNLQSNKDLGIVPYAILFGGIFFGCLYYASEMNGNVTFMDVFKHGFKMTTLIAAISGFWILISLKYVFPGVLEQAMQMIKQNMVKEGKSLEEADNFIKGYRNGALANSSIILVVFYLVIGAIGAMAGAEFSKKNPDYKPQQPAI